MKIKKASEELSQKYGRNATINEIAAVTELEPEEIVMAMEANSEVDSIYKKVYQSEGKDIYMIDQIVKNSQGSASFDSVAGLEAGRNTGGNGCAYDEEKEKLIDHLILTETINGLEEKERKIIEYRYFNDMTQSDVAKKLGISQVQVSRLEKKILKNMRQQILAT